MSVARISPLRSRMSGREVETASAARRTRLVVRRGGELDQPPGDDRIAERKDQDGEADAGARLSRCGRRCCP